MGAPADSPRREPLALLSPVWCPPVDSPRREPLALFSPVWGPPPLWFRVRVRARPKAQTNGKASPPAVEGGELIIPNCHEMALELVCGADFWCRTSPVVYEGFWGQVWPSIGRKPVPNSRIANEPLSVEQRQGTVVEHSRAWQTNIADSRGKRVASKHIIFI